MVCHRVKNIKPKDATNSEYAKLKRRFAFEFKGVRLHEYCLENLIQRERALDLENQPTSKWLDK